MQHMFFLICSLTACRKQTSPKSLKAKREHAREMGSQKPQRRLREMSAAEAIHAADYYEKTGPQELIISAYQRVIAVSLDPETVATYLKKLADLYLENENYKEAKSYYQKFVSLYPGHPLIIDVRYHEILAHFLSSLSPQRDQTTTHQVIKLGKHYLADYPEQTKQHDMVIEMVGAAYKRLLEKEIAVIYFYLNKFSIDQLGSSLYAALQRVSHIVKTMIPDMEQFIPGAADASEQLSAPQYGDDELDPATYNEHIALIAHDLQILESLLYSTATPSYSTAYFRDKF